MIGRYVFRKKIYFVLALLLDLAGYALAALRPKKDGPIDPRRILVVRLDHLGDALLASAAPKRLKEKFPAAKITFLTSSLGAAVLQSNPFVDEIIVYDAPWFSRNKESGQEPAESLSNLAGRLKRAGFDLALALRGDLRENLLVWMAGIPHRAGYGITGGGFFLNHEVPYRFGAHESEHTADVLRYFGADTRALMPQIYFSAQEEIALTARLGGWGLEPATEYVGLQLDAGSSAKSWSEEHARDFCGRFASDFPSKKIVFVGSDRAGSSRLMEAMRRENKGGSFLDMAGKTSLRELFFLLKKLRTFIGPDSGPTHAAAAMGLPTLFLYSGTNLFNQWKSLAPNAFFLRHEVPCSPCYLTECPVPGHPCMGLIRPESVMEWLKKEAWAS